MLLLALVRDRNTWTLLDRKRQIYSKSECLFLCILPNEVLSQLKLGTGGPNWITYDNFFPYFQREAKYGNLALYVKCHTLYTYKCT
jgi:hypothetical protein